MFLSFPHRSCAGLHQRTQQEVSVLFLAKNKASLSDRY